MTEREQLEKQILDVLAAETQAIPLSNKLFSPSGLFNQLAATEEERRVVARSALFQQAQRRLTELQRHEAAAFARAVEQTQSALPDQDYVLKLEWPEQVR
jgi:hypothetical protein